MGAGCPSHLRLSSLPSPPPQVPVLHPERLLGQPGHHPALRPAGRDAAGGGCPGRLRCPKATVTGTVSGGAGRPLSRPPKLCSAPHLVPPGLPRGREGRPDPADRKCWVRRGWWAWGGREGAARAPLSPPLSPAVPAHRGHLREHRGLQPPSAARPQGCAAARGADADPRPTGQPPDVPRHPDAAPQPAAEPPGIP